MKPFIITTESRRWGLLALAAGLILGGALACSKQEPPRTDTGAAPEAAKAPQAAPSPKDGLQGMREPAGVAEPVPTTPPPGTDVPSIYFPVTEHDFGRVYEGEKVKTEFDFENRGTAPLEITRVQTSCGCTIVEKPTAPVDPGGKGKIAVEFDSKRRKGDQEKDVRIFTNDPQRPLIKLKFSVDVVRRFWFEPDRIEFGLLTKNQPVEDKRLRVHWLKDFDIEVTGVEISNPAIEVETKPLEGEKSNALEITLHVTDLKPLLKNPMAGTQRISEFLTVRTNHPDHAESKIAVFGTVAPEVTVNPRILSYGVVSKRSKPVKRTLIVSAGTGFALDPPVVEQVPDYLDARVIPIRDGAQYQIEATLLPEKAPEGQQLKERIVIRTNSEDLPEISVSVFGKIQA